MLIIWINHLRIHIWRELLIQYVSISFAVTRDGTAIIFHLFCKVSMYQNSSSLFCSVTCLLSQNGDSSFLVNLFIGEISQIKRGPASGHLQASSK